MLELEPDRHDARGDRGRAQALYRQVAELQEPHHSSRATELALAGLEAPYSLPRIPAVGAGP